MSHLLKSAAAALALTMLGGVAEAAPYASMIRVSSTTFSGSLTINYRLNEAADSVTVNILNNSDAVVATFTGPTAKGANQVVWNGTVDNAAGALVGSGNHRVRITANKNAVAWSEISSNKSVGNYEPVATSQMTLFDGYSPQDHIYITDTDSDLFGVGLSINSYFSPAAWAAIRTHSDLSTVAGNGYADRILRATGLESDSTQDINDGFDLWGGNIDPDGERIYVVGQDDNPGYRVWQGNLSDPAAMIDADNSGHYALFPREIVIAKEGTDKYAYITQAGTITKTPIDDATGQLLSAPVNITAFTGSRYSKGLAMDADGNLYYTSAGIAHDVGTGGILLRWDASQIAGPNPAPLTEDNAVWKVTSPDSMLHMNSVAITPAGMVYVAFVLGADAGVYSVGSNTQATLEKVLGTADRVISLSALGTLVGGLSQTSAGLRSDPVGNLTVFDRNAEQIRLYGGPGNHSNAIVAPTSQTFAINASVDSWSLY